MASLLDDLKAETPISTGPTAASGPRRSSGTFESLQHYVRLYYVMKQIEGKLETHPLRSEVMAYMVETHRLLKAAPTKSIDARDGHGNTANVSLLKKNSRTKLSQETITLLEDLGVSVQERMLIKFKDDLPEDRINKALEVLKAAGIDFHTLFDVERKMLPSDQTLNDIFRLGENTSNERMAEIIGMVAGVTIRPKFNGELAEAFEACRVEFNPTAEEMAAAEKAAAANAKPGDGAAPKAAAKDNIMDALKRSLEADGGEDTGKSGKAGGKKRR